MGKPLLCLDFDGVVHAYDSPWTDGKTITDGPVPGALEFIQEALKSFRVAIYSSRSHQDGGLYAMKEWMWHCAEEADSGSGHAWVDDIEWPMEKPPAFLTIDDRAMLFTGNWPAVSSLLAFKPWNKQ